MTILEALTARFGQYPLSPAFVQSVLIGQGLNGADEFTEEVNNCKAYDIAYAEGLFGLVTSPRSVTEGNYSISSADSDSIWKLINWLRGKWGLTPIGTATVKFLADWC